MLFYAGRRTPQEAAALFRPLFDGLGVTPSLPRRRSCASAETVREVTESMDVTQGKLVIGMRTGITASDPDYPALVLLNSVYGSGVTSKLFVNVREKRSLCYYASSAVEKFKGLMIVSSGISFDQYETARDAILAELDACRRGEITPEELESARRSLISAVRAGLDTPAALDDWYIGMSIEPCDDPETMLQKLPALTVGGCRARSPAHHHGHDLFPEGRRSMTLHEFPRLGERYWEQRLKTACFSALFRSPALPAATPSSAWTTAPSTRPSRAAASPAARRTAWRTI